MGIRPVTIVLRSAELNNALRETLGGSFEYHFTQVAGNYLDKQLSPRGLASLIVLAWEAAFPLGTTLPATDNLRRFIDALTPGTLQGVGARVVKILEFVELLKPLSSDDTVRLSIPPA